MSNTLNLPNAIIAGAPKCGTTSLFNYLADHPEVCPARVKETKYLIDPGYPLYDEKCNYQSGGLSGYESFFAHCEDRHKIRLEATPDYIYQEAPLRCLTAFQQPPAIIFILRKPSERIYSLFRFAQNNMAILPPKMTFQEFLYLLETKDAGFEKRTILKNAIQHSHYSFYIKRWIQALGKENIHTFLFEEMVADQSKFIKKVCTLLGIEASFYDKYHPKRDNETISIRNQTIQRFKNKISDYIPEGAFKAVLKNINTAINVRKAKSPKSPEDLLALDKLNLEFRSEVDELQKLTGIQPDGWR
ncbi:MAG: sulfotransferase domain-containing protein [Deltaproteobacteria bacterium]|nr:sulfotransferase domain-containing protein [Deltaproteobacteria bacterium]